METNRWACPSYYNTLYAKQTRDSRRKGNGRQTQHTSDFNNSVLLQYAQHFPQGHNRRLLLPRLQCTIQRWVVHVRQHWPSHNGTCPPQPFSLGQFHLEELVISFLPEQGINLDLRIDNLLVNLLAFVEAHRATLKIFRIPNLRGLQYRTRSRLRSFATTCHTRGVSKPIASAYMA